MEYSIQEFEVNTLNDKSVDFGRSSLRHLHTPIGEIILVEVPININS